MFYKPFNILSSIGDTMAWIQKGDKFLSQISKNKLEKLYKNEKKVKAKLRLLAALKRKENQSLDEISCLLNKAKTTIHDWLKRFENHGLEKLYDKKQKGNRSKLTLLQLKELDEILSKEPTAQKIPFKLWTTTLVQYIVFERYNIAYNQSAIWKIVKKLNYNLKVPRPQNRKTNIKVKELFKKKLKKKLNITLNLDLRSSVLMKHTSQ